jgi:hypothetical protein
MGLTTLLLSCANCLKILGASTSWSLWGLSGSVRGHLYDLRKSLHEVICHGIRGTCGLTDELLASKEGPLFDRTFDRRSVYLRYFLYCIIEGLTVVILFCL